MGACANGDAASRTSRDGHPVLNRPLPTTVTRDNPVRLFEHRLLPRDETRNENSATYRGRDVPRHRASSRRASERMDRAERCVPVERNTPPRLPGGPAPALVAARSYL